VEKGMNATRTVLAFGLSVVAGGAALAQGTSRISIDSLGNQGNGSSYDGAISSNLLFMTFRSSATNLVAGDTNGHWDIFIHEFTSPNNSRT
jgi:hypothetical protein